MRWCRKTPKMFDKGRSQYVNNITEDRIWMFGTMSLQLFLNKYDRWGLRIGFG